MSFFLNVDGTLRALHSFPTRRSSDLGTFNGVTLNAALTIPTNTTLAVTNGLTLNNTLDRKSTRLNSSHRRISYTVSRLQNSSGGTLLAGGGATMTIASGMTAHWRGFL